jgi:VIT1/CCC1 family predicted Fe2+/Mn2+ transporter
MSLSGAGRRKLSSAPNTFGASHKIKTPINKTNLQLLIFTIALSSPFSLLTYAFVPLLPYFIIRYSLFVIRNSHHPLPSPQF